MLSVSYEPGTAADRLDSSDDVLAVFEFGLSPLRSIEPRHVPVALLPLDQPTRVEVWRCTGPVKTGQWDSLRFAQGEQLTMGHVAIDIAKAGNHREASRAAYDLVQSYLQQSPHPWPLKIWNYIPAINEGAGDDEHYRQFCLGRADSVLVEPGDRPQLPAATAIGTPADETALQVYFLAASLPGLDVENPRQVSAWRYPRQYGPKSPLFSRGTVLRCNGSFHFFISGTASVVGHRTHHEDQVVDQFSESLRNVHRLLEEGGRLLGNTRINLGADSLLKVYIRDPEQLGLIRAQIEQDLDTSIARMFLQGDICRSNLLIEIDGFVNGP